MTPMFPGSASGGPRSVPVETGQRERGDRCPNCAWPIKNPKAVALKTPSVGRFVCEHCGWSMNSPRHAGSGVTDIVPRPGRP